jgi:DNA-binding transcriptional LysR family regulator
LINIFDKLKITKTKIRGISNLDSMLFGVLSGWGIGVFSTAMDCVLDSRYRCFPLPELTMTEPVQIIHVWRKDNANPVIPLYLEFFKEFNKSDVSRLTSVN